MRTLGTLSLLALLTACAGDPPRAPVEDRYGRWVGHDAVIPDNYQVKRGDTLYAIAWRYSFDFRGLARANSIAAPYTIYPGQTLVLRESVHRTTSGAPAAKTASGTRSKSSSSRNSKVTARKQTGSGSGSGSAGAGKPVGKWRWPTEGKIVRGYSGTVHKGVDIDGKAGDAVRAVAAGKVVYAGSGIVGYGNLLIVKHNDIYLSAYGHNRSLLVQEGESVAVGQRIAEKGSSATNAVKLHFEIRREGKPVDPVTLLPSR
ncbi:MAG: peptidoglycan DD-metalloendopeptidase family protein [Gammaproteobacteria bacterium]|nr:peptidoglycan DD-metalloendopeptidase family protein [Gammaproteobacteria bacterium]